ncbi:MAG: methyltransferase [Armatimonadota bacterium]
MTWRETRLAREGTHHLRSETPLYEERFDEVLAFHEPGLAPVQRGGRGWHIRTDGSPAYNRRFERTFGYYEGRAAVVESDGWHHILPDGTDLYDARFDWCGNFQGGRCTVREPDGGYLHVDHDGVPAYEARWRYAGDYRDRIAVVQSHDGRSTHIDLGGTQIHGRWFLDLDVFHKGFARARDDDGWMHVDRRGLPIYTRRFAGVEPFYNGQARVERFDGGLEVIDEDGRRIVELRPALRSEFASLSGDLVGFWRTDAIAAAVELGVFDVLPGPEEPLLRACGIDSERGRRLLRSLAELRLVAFEDGIWTATERGEYLRADHPLTLRDAALEYAGRFRELWSNLPRALREGSDWKARNVFEDVAAEPMRIEGHHRMLASYALHDYGEVPAALSLRGDERIIDAGGGLGALAGLLLERYPDLEVVVLDRPEVIERAASAELGSRAELRTADITAPWDVEGDAVILARVLHDWDDAIALTILRHARCALRPGGRLFVVEMLLSDVGSAGGLCDLHLLMATGGKERTVEQYSVLLDEAGFDLVEVRRLAALPSIIVGVPR